MQSPSVLYPVVWLGSAKGLAFVATQALNAKFSSIWSQRHISSSHAGSYQHEPLRLISTPHPSTAVKNDAAQRSLFGMSIRTFTSSSGSACGYRSMSATYMMPSAAAAVGYPALSSCRGLDTVPNDGMDASSWLPPAQDTTALAPPEEPCMEQELEDAKALDSIATRAAAELPLLSPEQVRLLATAFAELGYRHRAFRKNLAHTLMQRCNDFSPSQLADVVWACCMLGYVDGGLMGCVLPYVQRNAGHFSTCSKNKMVWALTNCGYYNLARGIF